MEHILSFGGGVNSVALYLLLAERGERFRAVFADHGAEWPETYWYLFDFSIFFEDFDLPPIEVARPLVGGYSELEAYCLARRIIPTRRMRWCTARFKVEAVARQVGKPRVVYLGIDAGEAHRARPSSEAGVEFRYPLIEAGLDREGCKALIRSYGLAAPPKSGCWFCPFQKRDRWLLLAERHPDLLARAAEMERRACARREASGKEPLYLLKRPLLEQVSRWQAAHAARSRRGKGTGAAHGRQD